MPLRVTRRADTGTLWIVGTIRPAGAAQGVRIRRAAGTDDRRLAEEAAAALEREVLRTAWHGERRGTRTFAEAAEAYTADREHRPHTMMLIRRLALHAGPHTTLAQITQEWVDKARRGILKPGAAPATVRRGLIVPLTAVLSFASRRGWCDRPAFEGPRVAKGRTAFLMPAQVAHLLDAAEPRLRPLWTLAVCTGMRMQEMLTLEWAQVDLRGARILLWEGETKGGSRRVVELPPAAVAALAGIPGRAGVVFRNRRGQPYRGSEAGGGQLRKPWARICRAAEIEGITPHVLRHTWATWRYARAPDLLKLKEAGGWSSVTQVERYAHLMPTGHEDEIAAIWGLPSVARHWHAGAA